MLRVVGSTRLHSHTQNRYGSARSMTSMPHDGTSVLMWSPPVAEVSPAMLRWTHLCEWIMRPVPWGSRPQHFTQGRSAAESAPVYSSGGMKINRGIASLTSSEVRNDGFFFGGSGFFSGIRIGSSGTSGTPASRCWRISSRRCCGNRPVAFAHLMIVLLRHKGRFMSGKSTSGSWRR